MNIYLDEGKILEMHRTPENQMNLAGKAAKIRARLYIDDRELYEKLTETGKRLIDRLKELDDRRASRKEAYAKRVGKIANWKNVASLTKWVGIALVLAVFVMSIFPSTREVATWNQALSGVVVAGKGAMDDILNIRKATESREEYLEKKYSITNERTVILSHLASYLPKDYLPQAEVPLINF